MSHPVLCLDWEYVCDQSPEIQSMHKESDKRYEYGLSFWEFIHENDDLREEAKLWFNSLSEERKTELLSNRLKELKEKIDELIESAKEHNIKLLTE